MPMKLDRTLMDQFAIDVKDMTMRRMNAMVPNPTRPNTTTNFIRKMNFDKIVLAYRDYDDLVEAWFAMTMRLKGIEQPFNRDLANQMIDDISEQQKKSDNLAYQTRMRHPELRLSQI